MFKEEFQLPDGTIATCAADVDAYLRRSGDVSASDYSDNYKKSCRFFSERQQEKENFAEFLKQYKKRIWNE